MSIAKETMAKILNEFFHPYLPMKTHVPNPVPLLAEDNALQGVYGLHLQVRKYPDQSCIIASRREKE